MRPQITVPVFCLVLFAASAAHAQSLTVNGSSSATVAAGQDFATTVIGDPWDFSEATDYVLMFSEGWVRSTMTVGGGKFSGLVSSSDGLFPSLQLQFEGINGALNLVGRNGVRFPIDTSAYNQIAFRMRRSGQPNVFDFIDATWFQETTRTAANSGARIGLSTGFDDVHQRYINQSPVASQGAAVYHIYKMDLDRTLPVTTRDVNRPWTSSPVARGLRVALGEGVLAPGSLSNATIEVDWVRLVRRGIRTVTLAGSGFASRVTLTATNGTDSIQVFPDGALGANDNTVSPAGSFNSSFSFTWDVGFLPPGSWTITASDGSTSRQVTVNIATPPIIHLTEPDASGGTDFATAVIGDPWDLANAEDVTRYGLLNNITAASFGPSGMTAQSAAVGPVGPPTVEDPAVYLLTDDLRPGTSPPAIDANTYRHLTFTIEHLDNKTATGAEALSATLGAVTRVAWRRRITPPANVPLTDTQDIFVLDAGPQTYSMDLATFTTPGGSTCATCQLEDETSPGLHDIWAGPIGTFRIDPVEAHTSRSFRLANVRLAADDAPTSAGLFTIRWSATNATFAAAALTAGDQPAVADATVNLYYDTDTNPATKTLIASGLSAASGAYTWNLGGVPTGRYFIYAEITDSAGNTQSRYSTGPIRVATSFPGTQDSDGDGLPDAWESKYGVTSASADEDSDGLNNSAEFNAGTNPRIPNTWNLPEGATGFFLERIAVANPDTDESQISVTFLREAGSPIVQNYTIPGQSRATITVNDVPGLSSSAVSAVVNTTRGGVVVERTMLWNAQDGSFYGGHTGKAIQTARTQWYLAEGEASFFETYILFANANSGAATVTAQYLLESGAVITRTYTVNANARLTVRTNDIPGVAGNAFSTTITSNIPIAVERAMYFSTGGRLFNGGHEAAAVAAPATSWFVAEGRTGPFFDMYLLLANPGTVPANATVTFLTPSGSPVVITRTLGPTSRTTIHVDGVPGLTDTDVSASITANQPIIVERAMYWPDPFTNWYEAHNSAGATSTGIQWALAEGEVGGPLGFETYILFANPGSSPASVTLTLLRASGAPITSTFVVPANARVTRSAGEFGLASGERFGVLIDASQPIAVERAMYWNGGGQFWGGGTNETAVRLR